MEPLTGKTLGPYCILETLGEGGTAAVFKAYQPSVDRYVTAKVLPPQLSAEVQFTERFRREARLLAKLQHPFILPMFDYGEDDGYPYIAWWANDSVGHVQSKNWLEVGWRTTYINMSEGRVTFARIREREKAYIQFFSVLLNDLQRHTEFPLKDVSPDGASWIIVAGLPSKCPQVASFNYSFSRDRRFRAELYIDAYEKDVTKQIFDQLLAQKDALEAELGPLSWERINEKRASRIAVYHPGQITDSKQELAALHKWGVDAMIRLHKALADRTAQVVVEIVGG